MASFYDTTVGQQIEFQRVLSQAGFTDADIAHIIKELLASTMYASIQPKAMAIQPFLLVCPRSSGITPPPDLLEKVDRAFSFGIIMSI